jgi:NAD(P)H-dependent FMN reductase
MSDNSELKVKVIIGSTRENRFADKPAHWIFEEVKKEAGVEAEILDLRDYPMPFFEESVSPSRLNGNYANEKVRKWAAKVSDGDAFIIIAPEYNHGYPAVLKNALDSIYPEWNYKAVGFIGYGSVGGARSIEQLRQVVVELKMLPIRPALHLPMEIYVAAMNEKAPVNPEFFKSMKEGMFGDRVGQFLSELMVMAKTLKTHRNVG